MHITIYYFWLMKICYHVSFLFSRFSLTTCHLLLVHLCPSFIHLSSYFYPVLVYLVFNLQELVQMTPPPGSPS